LVHVIRDAAKGNLKQTPKIQKRRALLALHDLLMAYLLMALVRVLLEDFEETKNDSIITKARYNTTDALKKALYEFDPFNSVFGAFK